MKEEIIRLLNRAFVLHTAATSIHTFAAVRNWWWPGNWAINSSTTWMSSGPASLMIGSHSAVISLSTSDKGRLISCSW